MVELISHFGTKLVHSHFMVRIGY